MTTKRYAIVRVNICPEEFEEGKKNSRFCPEDGDCEKCRYGDTKEQLIAKVETAIEIAINKYEKGEILLANKNKALAEIIVEFLGVEDDR